jgi:hypothetical protein
MVIAIAIIVATAHESVAEGFYLVCNVTGTLGPATITVHIDTEAGSVSDIKGNRYITERFDSRVISYRNPPSFGFFVGTIDRIGGQMSYTVTDAGWERTYRGPCERTTAPRF